jgi:nucleotide-binding universal stress UspA family protein
MCSGIFTRTCPEHWCASRAGEEATVRESCAVEEFGMSGSRTILFPTDFSECSRQAFELARMLVQEQGARLVVLHVQHGLGPLVVYSDVFARLQPADYHEWLWKVLRRFQVPDAREPVEYRLVEGDPAREILAAAAEIDCDMIVMGTHGRSGLERLLLGSVSEQVLRKARCPVVMVKLPRHAKTSTNSPPPAAKSENMAVAAGTHPPVKIS